MKYMFTVTGTIDAAGEEEAKEQLANTLKSIDPNAEVEVDEENDEDEEEENRT